MGALAAVSPWLPEDDLLLRDSIERGASLESLAKGAAKFSRKFSVWELRDRWQSLLYDPVVSSEASFRMIEYEHSVQTLPLKVTRDGNSKENELVSGKRKSESVRSCYYALRRKIHNEPFNSMDLSFLVAPSNGILFGNGDEPLSRNCMLEDPSNNNFGLQDSNLDSMHHPFPDIPMADDAACRDDSTFHNFDGEFDHPVEEDFSMQQGDVNDELPHLFEESRSFAGNGIGVVGLDLPGQVSDMYEVDHLEATLPSTYGQNNADGGNVCAFEGNRVFHSPIADCGASFQNLEFSSPLPDLPMWRTVEDIPSPTVLVEDSPSTKKLHSGQTYVLPDDIDAKDTSAPGYSFVHADSKLKEQMSSDELKNEPGLLEELSNSLFDFSKDEGLFIDVDGKDKSYYEGLSLLLNSPNEAKHEMPSPEPETTAPDNLANAFAACPAESVEKVEMLSSASVSELQIPEQNEGFMVCTLNTEDPEIPCNDDVVLPNMLRPLSLSTAKRPNFKEAGNPFCNTVKDCSGNRKTSDPVLMQGGSSHIVGSQVIQDKSKLHPVGDSGVVLALRNCDSSQLAARTPCSGSIQNNSLSKSQDNLQCARLKVENKENAMMKSSDCTQTDSSVEKPDFGSKGCIDHDSNTNRMKQELNDPATSQEFQALNAEVGSVHIPDSEPITNPSTSEPEEPFIESDEEDVPYFSDIEAMILDMDLDPDDQDVYEQAVLKYQRDDTRMAIIRLEQGAHSYMRRAIASHGAFAILYGRHSKYYIKKSEVLVGRATEDVCVDIDLGREGRANKISRRQAIIKLDATGSFHLKNLGKFPILVNNKEVAPRQSLSLSSSCLIEIRGLPFLFESNQTCVKRFLASGTEEKHTQGHQV